MNKKLILIDGGPAVGKNTLGKILVDMFHKAGEKAVLLDLDRYVEEFNPKWVWDSEEQKDKDQLNARLNIAREINRKLKGAFTVLVVGEKILSKADVDKFMKKVDADCPIYLYHLRIPFEVREKRLHERGPHTLIDLSKDQQEGDAVKNWPGYVYENINVPETDASNLFRLIQRGKGLLH